MMRGWEKGLEFSLSWILRKDFIFALLLKEMEAHHICVTVIWIMEMQMNLK